MKRIVIFGLMATTLLSAMPAAAQRGERNGRGQGEWVNGPRPNQSAEPDERGGRERSRPAPEQRAAPAVSNAPVPASNADRSQWRRGGDSTPRVSAPDAGNGQGRQWNGNRDRGAVAAPPVPPAQPAQPAQRNWSRDDNRGGNRDRGNWSSNDDRQRGDWNRGDRDNGIRDRGNWNNNRNDGSRDRNWSYQGRLNDRDRWADTRRWDNDWRNNSRYDWQRYRTQNRYAYRQPTYHAPYGWNYGYRRFSIGIYLSNMLFSSSYWIDDPYDYRLPPAYGPLRWVRYYDDALLVDIRDGYVVDVIHGFFW